MDKTWAYQSAGFTVGGRSQTLLSLRTHGAMDKTWTYQAGGFTGRGRSRGLSSLVSLGKNLGPIFSPHFDDSTLMLTLTFTLNPNPNLNVLMIFKKSCLD